MTTPERYRSLTLQRWLQTHDADHFIDDAVMGCLPQWEADEVLEEHGITPTAETRAMLMRMVDSALCAGTA